MYYQTSHNTMISAMRVYERVRDIGVSGVI